MLGSFVVIVAFVVMVCRLGAVDDEVLKKGWCSAGG